MKTIIQSVYVFLFLFTSSYIAKAQLVAADCIGKKSTKPCTSIPDNVCGCDGKTYANPCAANAAGVRDFTKGPCNVKTGTGVTAPDDECFEKPDPRISINCLNVLDPVCGCDGKEYPNDCLARVAGVKKFVKGRCNQKPGNGHSDTPSPGCGAIYNHITTQPSDFYSPACKVVIDIYPIQSSSATVSDADNAKKRFSLAKDVVITERDKCLENIFCVPSKVFNVGADSSGVSDFRLFNDAIIKVEENGNFEVRTKKDRFLTGGTFSKPNSKNEIWSNCIYNNKNYAVRMTWLKGVVDNRNNFEVK
jgi:hypothetical protein